MRPKCMRLRPGHHETEAETKTKKVVWGPHWSWDLNIPALHLC